MVIKELKKLDATKPPRPDNIYNKILKDATKPNEYRPIAITYYLKSIQTDNSTRNAQPHKKIMENKQAILNSTCSTYNVCISPSN
jgi:hypothetical protein